MISGADSNQLDLLAQRFGDSAARLEQNLAQLRSLSRQAVWQGADARLFEQVFNQRLSPTVTRDIEMLREASVVLRRNAEEQRRASSQDGTGTSGAGFGAIGAAAAIGGIGAAGTRVGDRIPPGAHVTTSDYARELDKLGENEFLLRKVSDGPPPRYVLLLRGATVGVGGLNGMDTAAADFVGTDSRYQAAVREVLAKLPRDAEIGIIGHSQGGIVAADIAQGDPRVKDLFILGSPIDHKAIPDGVRALEFEHRGDTVPGLDGGGFGNAHKIAKANFALDGQPSYGVFDGFQGAHGVTANYLPAIDAAAGSGNGVSFASAADAASASEFVKAFEQRYGGGPGSGAMVTARPR